MEKHNIRQIAALTERLGRLLGTDAHATGLLPVHWETLRYLDRANRFSRNSTALTAFLGSTKGTVSQTIKALEGKGLVSNKADAKDRRRNRISLTAKGKRLLKDDPIRELEDAAAALPASIRTSLAYGLQQLLSKRLDAQGRHPFGQCRECVYFAPEHESGDPHFCTLLRETLAEADAEAICYEQVARP